MYNPTGFFLQLLYSILPHNGKALTFALISCEDSVLFVQSHFISVYFGAGLSSVLQCNNVGRKVEFLHPFQSLYPCYQLPTTSLTGPGLSKSFFICELPWILPSLSTDATALKSASSFPDTLWCPKTLFPGCPMEGFHVSSLSLLYLDHRLQRCETEKM